MMNDIMNEPMMLTVNVAQGNWLESMNWPTENLRTAPMAPPNATSRISVGVIMLSDQSMGYPTEEKSKVRVVAPSRFEDTESYLAALLFGSISAVVEIGNRFEEYNREVGADA